MDYESKRVFLWFPTPVWRSWGNELFPRVRWLCFAMRGDMIDGRGRRTRVYIRD